MKTFVVEKEVLVIDTTHRYNVARDGSNVGSKYEIDDIGGPKELTTGFVVHSYDDGEHLMTDFYPVEINTSQWTDNSDEVLDKIEQDYPAGEWQNHDW